MNALYTKLAVFGVVLLIILGLVWRLQIVENQRDKAKDDAAAYRQVAIANYQYIEKYNKEKAANEAWEAEANNEADKIIETGCPKLPDDFRAWLKRL